MWVARESPKQVAQLPTRVPACIAVTHSPQSLPSNGTYDQSTDAAVQALSVLCCHGAYNRTWHKNLMFLANLRKTISTSVGEGMDSRQMEEKGMRLEFTDTHC